MQFLEGIIATRVGNVIIVVNEPIFINRHPGGK